MVPMLRGSECIGFCGFDSVRNRRHYSSREQRLLQVFAQMLVNPWLHEDTRRRLQQLSKCHLPPLSCGATSLGSLSTMPATTPASWATPLRSSLPGMLSMAS